MVVARSRLTALVWAVGFAAIALMAIGALAYLWRTSIRPWRIDPGLPIGDLAIAAALLLAVAIAIIGTYVIGGARPRLAIGLSVAALVVVRLVVVLAVDARLFSDFGAYRAIATGMLAGQGFWTSLPPGYPALEAVAIAVGGDSLLSAELLNGLLGLIAGLSILLIVRRAAGERAAAVATMAFALMPSQALFTVVLGTEVAYGASLALVALAAQRAAQGRIAPILACGVLLGLSQYVRPTSQFFLVALLATLVLAVPRPRAAVRPAIVLVLGFLVTVLPIAGWNLAANERLSLSPSLFDKWTVYVGLNVASRGQYRVSDRQHVAAAAGVPVPIVGDGLPGARFRPAFLAQSRAFNDAAGELVPERLRANGFRSLRIQPAKVQVMWERADSAVDLVFGPASPQPSRDAAAIAGLVAQVAWVALLGGALLALIVGRRDRPPEITLVLLVILTALAIHAVTEVQPRYHEYYVPLLCVLVGVALGGRRWGSPVTASAAAPGPTETPAEGPTAGAYFRLGNRSVMSSSWLRLTEPSDVRTRSGSMA